MQSVLLESPVRQALFPRLDAGLDAALSRFEFDEAHTVLASNAVVVSAIVTYLALILALHVRAEPSRLPRAPRACLATHSRRASLTPRFYCWIYP